MSILREIQKIVLPTHARGVETRTSYREIGGLHRELELVREVVERPLKEPEIFTHFGITPPKGILLYGPPGCGKTLIARAVAQETGAHFIGVNGSDIVRNHYGESEQRLREIFQEAQDYPYTILFFDEIDALAPKRDSLSDEVERRLVSELLALLDGIHSRGNVVLLAATNLPNHLDPALRRPGRLDREIHIQPPDKEGRKEILTIHTRKIPLDETVDLDVLAEETPGFLGADLEILCKEAAMHRIRSLSQQDYREKCVRMEDFQKALSQISISTNREEKRELPTVHFADIGGLKKEKAFISQWAALSLQYSLPQSLLLSGAPGVGKTMLAYALAEKTKDRMNFILVRGPELLSKWAGESEKGIRGIFCKAKQSAPCILFFDEIDALLPRRVSSENDGNLSNRIVSQFLAEMDDLPGKQVLLLAATNRPDLLDPAITRSGRFDMKMEIPKPTTEDRLEILRLLLSAKRQADSLSLSRLAEQTAGFTGSDLTSLLKMGEMRAIQYQLEHQEPPDEWKLTEELLESTIKDFKQGI